MADQTIVTEREFVTNGTRIPAGKLSTQDIQDLVTVPADKKGDKMRHLTAEEAAAVQEDLMRRQQHYQRYTRGITERHSTIQDAGKVSMGGGSGE